MSISVCYFTLVSGAAVIQVAKKIRLKLSFLGNSLNWSVSFDRMFGYKNEALASKAPSSLVWSVETGCGNSERQERLKFLWLNHYVNEAGAGETAFLSGRHHVVAEWLFKNETPVTATSPPGGGSLHTSSDRWKQMTESRFHMIDCVFYSLFALKRCQSGIWGLLYEHLHITRHTHTLHPHLSWHYSFKLNSETPFSMLLFLLPLPPLPCQHHVRPGRSMWQAAGIMLTFSAPCSSASLSQTPQSTVNHLGQQRSEPAWEPDITPWKTKFLHGTKTRLWAEKVLWGSSSWCCTI